MTVPSRRLVGAPNFRWLLAETLVIVLGVLIALALNDIWVEKEERQLEISYLERLEQDFRLDLEYITNGYKPGVERKMQALQYVLPYVRGQEPIPEEPLDFLMNISLGGILSASKRLDFATDATYRDLQSTGNMRLIGDTDVRSSIVRYYQSIENEVTRIEGRNSGYTQFVHGVIPAELRDEMNMAAIREVGVEFAIRRLTSDEFRTIANAEHNKALLMGQIPFQDTIENMIDMIVAYRRSL